MAPVTDPANALDVSDPSAVNVYVELVHARQTLWHTYRAFASAACSPPEPVRQLLPISNSQPLKAAPLPQVPQRGDSLLPRHSDDAVPVARASESNPARPRRDYLEWTIRELTADLVSATKGTSTQLHLDWSVQARPARR